MTKRAVLVCALLAVALLGAVDTASACYSRCVRVDDGTYFCRRCLDVGTYTGITCQDSGSCGCFLTQNTCGTAPQAAARVQPQEPQGEVCQALAFADVAGMPAPAN